MFKLSKLAADDFAATYEYTLLNFGVRQADAYTNELGKVLALLASSPLMGPAHQELGENVKRHDHQQHAIFYCSRELDIFVLRILHQQIESTRHLLNLPL